MDCAGAGGALYRISYLALYGRGHRIAIAASTKMLNIRFYEHFDIAAEVLIIFLKICSAHSFLLRSKYVSYTRYIFMILSALLIAF